MSDSVEGVTVIVRSIGERTTDACVEHLSRQVPSEALVLVQDLPYEECVTRTYEIGLDADRPWTLVVDADVIPRRTMVGDVLEAAQTHEGELFALEAQVVDKFFGGPRTAGNTLYRTGLLESALEVVPTEEDCARPETKTIRRMATDGHPSAYPNVVVGVHEFEQSYRDLVRKGDTFATKRPHTVPILRPYWNRRASEDPDFRVFRDVVGRAMNAPAVETYDRAGHSEAKAEWVCDRLGLTERDPLELERALFDEVEGWIARSPPPEYVRHRRLAHLREHSLWPQLPRPLRYLLILLLQKPPSRAVPWTLGRIMERAGIALKRRAP